MQGTRSIGATHRHQTQNGRGGVSQRQHQQKRVQCARTVQREPEAQRATNQYEIDARACKRNQRFVAWRSTYLIVGVNVGNRVEAMEDDPRHLDTIAPSDDGVPELVQQQRDFAREYRCSGR